MTQLIESFKETFLKKPQTQESQYSDSYVLEDEFASTVTSKSWTVRVVIIIALLVSLVTAVSSFFLMRQEERDIKIDIVEFKDVELKKLVDQSVDKKTDLGQLRSELLALEREQRAETIKVKVEIQRQLNEARSVSASKQQIAEINNLGVQSITTLDVAFKKQRDALQQKIKSLNLSIDQNNLQVAGLSNGDSALHSSGEQLNELRINKLTRYYEDRLTALNTKHDQELEQLMLRYNPPLAENSVGELLARPVKALIPVDLSKQRRDYLMTQAPEAESIVSNQRRWNKESEDIIRAMREIPFNNQSQLSAIHLQDTTRKQQNEFNQLAILFSDSMKTRELKQNNYRDLLSQILGQLYQSQPVVGQISKSVNADTWSLELSEQIDPKIIFMAAVMNKTKGFKGLIEVTQEKNRYFGKPLASNTGLNFELRDRVVIILKQATY